MLVQGPRLTREGFVDGWIDVEDGVVRATGAGGPPATPDVRGLVVPAPVNGHTHVGDRALRGRLDPSLGLAALVEPPDGLKHRLLRETPQAALEAGMATALEELARHGAAAAFDFREGGLEGVTALRAAAEATGFPVRILGRVEAGADDKALRAVVDAADGLGMPAIGNLEPGEAAAWAAAARSAGKPLALHASEGEREDVEPVVALAPHHVVHMTRGTASDFEALAARDVPLVVCPRSNATLVGRLPDVRSMLDAGATVALGTDNASLQDGDVVEEMRFLARHARDLDSVEVLRMGLVHGHRLLGRDVEGVEEGVEVPLLVLEEGAGAEGTLLGEPPVVVRARLP